MPLTRRARFVRLWPVRPKTARALGLVVFPNGRVGASLYRETTRQIEVEVRPQYVAEQSEPQRGFYLFAYHVTVHNGSDETIQLLDRHWIIMDGHGQREDVQGEGVVGAQPLIRPGKSFAYTSACPLGTPTGNMRGTYGVRSETGERFRIRVPLFFLRHPSTFSVAPEMHA